MKVPVFIATRLAGFITRKNGDIDWLLTILITQKIMVIKNFQIP